MKKADPANKYSDHRTYSSEREAVEKEQEKLVDVGGAGLDMYGEGGVRGGLETVALVIMCSCVCIAVAVYNYYLMQVDKYIVFT